MIASFRMRAGNWAPVSSDTLSGLVSPKPEKGVSRLLLLLLLVPTCRSRDVFVASGAQRVVGQVGWLIVCTRVGVRVCAEQGTVWGDLLGSWPVELLRLDLPRQSRERVWLGPGAIRGLRNGDAGVLTGVPGVDWGGG